MARMVGVFSHIKGKIGNMIYKTWHGIQVITTMFIPSNPQSEAQTQQRDKFLFILELGELIYEDLITVIWNPFRRGSSTGWSNFLKTNLLSQSGQNISYSLFILSKGSIFPSQIDSAVYNTANGECTITFDQSIYNNQDLDDLAGAFLIESDTNKSFYNMGLSVQKRDGSIIITCEEGLTATNCHAHLFFVRKSGTIVKKVSDCTYSVCSAP